MRNPSDVQGGNERQRKKKCGREHVRQSLHKGDVTRDDSQRRFLAQHIVVTIRNKVETMLQRCTALKIVVANRLM